jgi:predicted ATPase
MKMLDKLTIRNFKCFEKLTLEMSGLNVLSGINSMGKSTIIQALLLLRQTFERGSLDKGLHLNGSYVNIGTGRDLLCRYGEDDEIGIILESGLNRFELAYDYTQDSDYLVLKKPPCENEHPVLEPYSLFSNRFDYISAERLGPRRSYGKSHYDIFDKNQVGLQGQMAVDYLFERGRDRIENKDALHNAEESPLLEHQVNAWLDEISPGVKVETKSFLDAGLVGLNYTVMGSYGANEYNAMNVGFGITYVLPIVVSVLKAKRGDLLIIENPEAHLHPKGQRKIGELIARAAAGGVQIILETHSDHILNGLRLSVKKTHISRFQIRLNYFYRIEKQNKIKHEKSSPAILEDGSLSDWPEGFFDEWDTAIDELF